MRKWILCFTLALSLTPRLSAQSLPADVRPSHWASGAVTSVLANKVMSLPDGKQFRGEAKVTRTEAIIAIANLARALESQRWKSGKSVAIVKRADTLADQDEWKTQPLTRFAFARVLSHAGDFFANGVRRATPNAPDKGKSITLPPRATVSLTSKHPAFASVTYLVSKNGIWGGNPLLNPDDKPVTGKEVSTALAQMMVGLSDSLTSLGKEADGSTPDHSFQKRRN